MVTRPNDLQVVSNAELAIGTTFNERQVELIRNQIAPDATPEELMLFLQVASSRGLDPFRKHIYAVSRWDSQKRKNVTAYQVSIDGLRLIAERSGKYEGQVGPVWCGQDGIWHDVWLQDTPPLAAKIGVLKRGFREPLFAVAKFSTYVQTTKEGRPTKFWASMPEVMIAKVAEAAALRRAFPEEAGGLYVTEEMDQADNPVDLTPAGDFYDVSTGEIRQPAPPRAEAPPDVARAMARVHAVAAEHGITHDDLHNWAVSKNLHSLKRATARQLDTMSDYITNNTQEAKSHFDRLRRANESAPEPVEVQHRPINTAPMTQDEMDAADAATPTSEPLPGVSGGSHRGGERWTR